jgi:hypothetical protein
VEEARASVREHAGASRDATRWRQGDTQAWGWVAVTTWVTGGVVRRSRGGHVARALLGKPCAGLRVTERESADNGDPVR